MLVGVLQRVLREIGGAPGSALEGALPVDDHRKSTLESTPWTTPNFPEHPAKHPDFPEHPREYFPEHFQGIPTLAPLRDHRPSKWFPTKFKKNCQIQPTKQLVPAWSCRTKSLRPAAAPPPSWVPSLAIPIGGGGGVGTASTQRRE